MDDHLIIFDLDQTLIDGDSDYLFGQFLVDIGAVDKNQAEKRNQQFYDDYVNQQLNVEEYLAFALRIFDLIDYQRLLSFRQTFVNDIIKPLVFPEALELINEHRQRHHQLLVSTSTNRFIVELIVQQLFGIPQLICSEPVIHQHRYTSQLQSHNYADQKVSNLIAWLDRHQKKQTTKTSWQIHFYSDSANDLPLLNFVDHPVAVNPDHKLRSTAEQNNWRILQFDQLRG